MSDCGVCIYSGGDYGDNGFWMETRVVKGDRECCECGEVIPAGTPHEFAGYRDYDEKWEYQRTCAVCAEIAWAFACDGRCYGNLWESLKESFEEIGFGCFAKLKAAAAKTELQSRWMEWKGLAA